MVRTTIMMKTIVGAVMAAVLLRACTGFVTPQSQAVVRSNSKLAAEISPTPPPPPPARKFQIPLIGRFRRKKEVEPPVDPIGKSKALPDMDVVRAGSGDPVSIREALPGKAILVGMPGAFTPTCTKIHLPGYIEKAPDFANLGYSTIGILTTNDRYVNEAWSDAVGLDLAGEESPLTVLCDGDGDLVKNMGLADDMGFGVGVRSQRFALALDNGVVTHMLTDQGMDDCAATSAVNMLREVAPPGTALDVGDEVNFQALALVAGIGAAVLFAMSGGNNMFSM